MNEMENITNTSSVFTVMVNESDFESERIFVQNWRFVLEGILIPCIGIPGILGMSNTKLIFLLDHCVREHNDPDGVTATGPGAKAHLPAHALTAAGLRLFLYPPDQHHVQPPCGVHQVRPVHLPPPHPRPAPHHPDIPHHLRVHHHRGRRGEVRLNLDSHAAASGEILS